MIRKVNKILLSFFIIVSVVVGAFSFEKVNALSMTPYTTFALGGYTAECYKNFTPSGASASYGYGGLEVNLPIGSSSSVFHFHADFKDEYSGYIKIDITTYGSFMLDDCSYGLTGGWISNQTAGGNNTNSKSFRLNFYHNSEGIDFMLVSPYSTVFDESTTTFTLSVNTSNVNDIYDYMSVFQTDLNNLESIVSLNFDYKLSDMNTTLSQGFSDMGDYLDDIFDEVDIISSYIQLRRNFTIPVDMIPAYLLFNVDISSSGLQQDPTELYPYYSFTGYKQSKVFRIEANSSLYFYVLSSTSGYHVGLSNSDFTITSERLAEYQVAGSSIFKLTVSNSTNSSATTRLYFDYYSLDTNNNRTDILGTFTPLYFGSGVGMSDELRSLLGIEDPIVTLLQDFLGNNTVPSGLQTIFNDVLTSISDFYSNLTSYLPNKRDFILDMQDASNNPEYRITDCLSFVNYFYGEMITTFPALQTFTVLGLSVMVIRMFIK